MAARNAFPEDDPLFAGFLAVDHAAIVAAFSRHDLILVPGAPVFTYHVEGAGPHIPDGAALFQITHDPALAEAATARTPILGNVRDALVGFGRRFGLDRTIGTDLPGLDFVGLAEAQGVAAIRVDRAESLDAALARSLASPVPNLVEVMLA